jgi:hypothetical protein
LTEVMKRCCEMRPGSMVFYVRSIRTRGL